MATVNQCLVNWWSIEKCTHTHTHSASSIIQYLVMNIKFMFFLADLWLCVCVWCAVRAIISELQMYYFNISAVTRSTLLIFLFSEQSQSVCGLLLNSWKHQHQSISFCCCFVSFVFVRNRPFVMSQQALTYLSDYWPDPQPGVGSAIFFFAAASNEPMLNKSTFWKFEVVA